MMPKILYKGNLIKGKKMRHTKLSVGDPKRRFGWWGAQS